MMTPSIQTSGYEREAPGKGPEPPGKWPTPDLGQGNAGGAWDTLFVAESRKLSKINGFMSKGHRQQLGGTPTGQTETISASKRKMMVGDDTGITKSHVFLRNSNRRNPETLLGPP